MDRPPKAATEASGWSDYRLDVDFTTESGVAGIIFRAQDASDYYMWQIQTDGDEVLLRPTDAATGSGASSTKSTSTTHCRPPRRMNSAI